MSSLYGMKVSESAGGEIPHMVGDDGTYIEKFIWPIRIYFPATWDEELLYTTHL